jgi:hypothetical protein
MQLRYEAKSLMGIKIRVRLEPALEEKVGKMTAAQRRILAALYERWAHQLRLSAAIMDRDASPKPCRKSIKFIASYKTKMN